METLFDETLLEDVSLEEMAKKGEAIYDACRHKYEPQHNEKSLIIEVGSGKCYMGETVKDALAKAKKEHPDKLFYLRTIGVDALAILENSFKKRQ
jgi:hypothetical protein